MDKDHIVINCESNAEIWWTEKQYDKEHSCIRALPHYELWKSPDSWPKKKWSIQIRSFSKIKKNGKFPEGELKNYIAMIRMTSQELQWLFDWFKLKGAVK